MNFISFTAGFLLHFKTVHLQLKPYKCQYCDQSFAVKGTMKDHEKRHTGEKNYHCEFCGKGFIQRAAIKAHRDRCMVGK
jgi:zinc finger/BTB domain-containing protein 38